ncbi:MAG: protein tyrosine phosphatase [Burkholderiales bacterium RIFCSPLOWO2_12_FULL_64_99]|nr:MAG: protein tyrosine phosphatase [Burkholderiales bacterium RIFCSPHIGHO2_12_FULL_63_20]OGB64517.1 MAG: protein tyrosine phosphatase [Burkholderiales bacterium RIFCSPLOWO2_12_FULL_64_99]
MRILTLCVGNICRSPIAEALLVRDLPAHTVASAGLGALVGQPADALAQAVAAEHGLDLSPHRAQQVTGWLCQQSDLILVMEQAHQTELERQFPVIRGKVYRLGHLGQFDVADPYRQPRSAFDEAYAAIAQGVADWVPRIQQLS